MSSLIGAYVIYIYIFRILTVDVLCAASTDVVFVQIPGCLFPYGTPISPRPGWWTMGLGDVPLGGSEGHRNGEMLAPGQAMGSL